MIKITCKLTGHELSLVSAPVVSSDSVGFDAVKFQFDTNWTGFHKVAVFWGSDTDTAYGSLVDDNDEAVIPTAILEEKATIRFGVFGEDPDGLLPRITSTILKYKIKEGAWSESFYGDDEATQSLVDQLRVLVFAISEETHRFIEDSTEAYETFTENSTEAYETFTENSTEAYEAFTQECTDIVEAAKDYVLDAMETKVEEDMPGIITGWLDDHVNPESDVVIDDTLSISGAAADAAACGELKSAIDNICDVENNENSLFNWQNVFTKIDGDAQGYYNNYGTYIQSTRYNATKLIDLRGSTTVKAFAPSDCWITFWKVNTSFDSGVVVNSEATISVPPTAKYVIISYNNEGGSPTILVNCLENKIATTKNKISKAYNDFSIIGEVENESGVGFQISDAIVDNIFDVDIESVEAFVDVEICKKNIIDIDTYGQVTAGSASRYGYKTHKLKSGKYFLSWEKTGASTFYLGYNLNGEFYVPFSSSATTLASTEIIIQKDSEVVIFTNTSVNPLSRIMLANTNTSYEAYTGQRATYNTTTDELSNDLALYEGETNVFVDNATLVKFKYRQKTDTKIKQLEEQSRNISVDLDSFEGETLEEKLKNALDTIECGTITCGRITFTTPYYAKPNKDYRKITLINSSIILNVNGWFVTNTNGSGYGIGIKFNNCNIIGNGRELFSSPSLSLVGASFNGCYLDNVVIFNNQTQFVQSLYIQNSEIHQDGYNLCLAERYWDLNINGCRVEEGTGILFKSVYSAQHDGNHINIVNTLVEGRTTDIPFQFNACSIINICNCYFEGNWKGLLKFSSSTLATTVFNLSNNTFYEDANHFEANEVITALIDPTEINISNNLVILPAGKSLTSFST